MTHLLQAMILIVVATPLFAIAARVLEMETSPLGLAVYLALLVGLHALWFRFVRRR
ncbi:hypothetical protein ACQ5SO_02600 [Rhodovulum sp. DZ06]|uniref:hypothetical protein n=1 Tax=Rhodovulum sp. DZ06 TaxID=3425126 RepID=UPI003D325C06